MSMKPTRSYLAIFTIIFLCLFASTSVWAEKQVILVLDASGSMWGQINDKPKITIAREVVADMLANWNADNQIGLVTYGHREKGECSDIETLIPVGKLDAVAFNQAVADLNPKGKTPLTAAVRLAAEQLKYTETTATVILVSDGKETCEADPCAVANELEKAGIDFTTHVIGFDVNEQEGLTQLQCIANNTGGEFLTAKDASGLKEALETAVKKVEAAPEPESKPTPEPQVDLSKPVNLRINAVLAEGGEPVSGNDFRVYREELDEYGKPNRVQVARDYYKQDVNFDLAPGEYIAVGYLGDAYIESPIKIEPGKALDVQLVYNAARVKINAALAEGADKIAGNDIRVYREEKDDFGKPERVQVSRDYYKEEVIFTIPAGEYIAVSYLGSAVAEKSLTVEAGKGMELQLIYNAGKVKMNAVLAEGGEKVSGNDLRVYRQENDEFGKPQPVQVARDYYKQEVVFIIPAGEYSAVSYLGNAEANQVFLVEPGTAVEQTLIYNAGRLKINAVSQAGGPKVGGNDIRVYREAKDEFGEAQRIQIARDYYKEEVVFTVPVGDYIIEVLNKELTGTATVTVPAGQGVESEVLLNKNSK